MFKFINKTTFLLNRAFFQLPQKYIVGQSVLFAISQNTTRSVSSLFTIQMAEAVQAQNEAKSEANKNKMNKKKDAYKSRYNGRVKKRSWINFDEDKGDPEKRACFNPEDRIKKKKYCLLLGYSGANYFGMQRNPKMKTIEEDLLVAMLKNKWITEDSFNQIQNIQFQRAARTDKGVSAARQCVSVKLPEEINIDDLNKDLPEQIRLFGAKRVTKGFNSKEKCCGRTYTYMLPTIAFADYNDLEAVDLAKYRVPSEKIIKVNEILKMYLGTKCFHNFTSRKEFMDPSSKRYIISFDCGEPFTVNDVEFAVLKVKGQSFMLHQIRKMVGLMLAIVRGITVPETITRAFTEVRIDIPMAPGLGLVLDQVHYDRYNDRYSTDGIHEALKWDTEEPIIKEFFDTYIAPTIVNTEISEKPMINWLETLPLHSYDVRTADAKPLNDEEEECGGDDDEDDDHAGVIEKSDKKIDLKEENSITTPGTSEVKTNINIEVENNDKIEKVNV